MRGMNRTDSLMNRQTEKTRRRRFSDEVLLPPPPSLPPSPTTVYSFTSEQCTWKKAVKVNHDFFSFSVEENSFGKRNEVKKLIF